MRRTTLFAVLGATIMLLSVGAPIAAADDGESETEIDDLNVAAWQDDDATATVSVTANVTDDGNTTSVNVENASVTVTTDDENVTYDGLGEYETDESGTVGLPAPNESVSIDVTASYDNETATTSLGLDPEVDEDEGDEPSFGEKHSSFVHDLLNSNDTDGPIGAAVATHAVENNPGNAPDHAGPPDWLLNRSSDGPPGQDGNQTGPPDHAGPPGDDGNATDDDSGGPPSDAGPGSDDDDDDSGGPPSDTGPGSDDDDDDSGGPPSHAGPPGDDDEDDE